MFVAHCLIFGSKSWRSFHWIGCTLMKFNLFFIFLILSHAILLSSIFYLDYCQWKGHQVKACRSFPLRTFVQAVLFNKHNLLVPGNIQFLLHQALNDFWLTSPLLPLVSPWHTSLRFFQLGSPYSLQRLYCILILPHRFGSSFFILLTKVTCGSSNHCSHNTYLIPFGFQIHPSATSFYSTNIGKFAAFAMSCTSFLPECCIQASLNQCTSLFLAAFLSFSLSLHHNN